MSDIEPRRFKLYLTITVAVLFGMVSLIVGVLADSRVARECRETCVAKGSAAECALSASRVCDLGAR